MMMRSVSPPESPFYGNSLYAAKGSFEKRYERAFGEVVFVPASPQSPAKPCVPPPRVDSPKLGERYENAFGAIQMSSPSPK